MFTDPEMASQRICEAYETITICPPEETPIGSIDFTAIERTPMNKKQPKWRAVRAAVLKQLDDMNADIVLVFSIIVFFTFCLGPVICGPTPSLMR